MIVFIGVLSGQVTGQFRTTDFIISTVSEKYISEKIIIKQPLKVNFILLFRYYCLVLKFLFLRRPDCVYFSFSRTFKSFIVRDMIVLIGVLVCKTPTVLHLVGSDFPSFCNSSVLVKLLYRSILSRKITKLICLSLRMRDEVVSCLGLKGDFSNWPILPGFVGDRVVEANSNPPSIDFIKSDQLVQVVGFMSNLITEKGIFDFLAAVEEILLSKCSKNYRFWVAGRKQIDVDYSFLDELVSKGFIQYFDFIDGDEKHNLLTETDIFVLPTYYPTEALPLSLLEAAFYGCFIISCDSGDIKDLVSGAGGVLVEPRNTQQIVDAILDYECDSFDRNLPRGFVLNNFSSSSYRRKIVDIFF